jgi:hypothetical protein
MKKKLIAMFVASAMTCTMLGGCGSTQKAPETAEQDVTVEQTDTAEQEQTTEQKTATEEESQSDSEEAVGIANPWVTITEEEANKNCIRLFKAPEGATNQEWSMCEELGDPDKGVGPLIQLSFTLDDLNYTARAQQGASPDADIAGNYVEWTVGPEEATLANWGEGNMAGETYRRLDDSGYLDMITWYDVEIGISYSLTVGAEDLDGFDIQGVAEQMYCADNEPEIP